MTPSEQLFAALDRDHVRYFAKNGQLNVGGIVKTPSILDQVVSNLGGSWAIYVTLNRTGNGPSIKARSQDVTTWEYVLIDVDPITVGADPDAALLTVLAEADKLVGNASRSCHLLASGRGVQAWMKVKPVSLLSTERRTVERSMWAFLTAIDPMVHGCRVDTACCDLARVARCPGTVNGKTGRVAEFKAFAKEVVNPQYILDLCPQDEVPPHRARLTAGLPLSHILPHLTQRAATFLTQGVITPGRHAAAYAAAISLAEAQVPEHEAMTLVLRAASYCSPPLDQGQAARALRNAYRKGA